MGLAYLHDIMVMLIFSHGPTLTRYRDAKMAFLAAGDVEFLPYWTNGDVFSTGTDAVKVSAYRRPGACLLMAMNLNKEPTAAVITVNLKALGLEGGGVRATDAVTGDAIPFTSGALALRLQGRWLHMIKLEAERR